MEKYLLRCTSRTGSRAVTLDERTGETQTVQVYCSADYLDLAQDRDVLAAAKEATDTFGASISSVPLIAGSCSVHAQLEQELAEFLGYPACVIFPTGHSANASTIAALCSSDDVVVLDKQVHYSVLEGVRLSGAKWKTFRHNDPDHLGQVLAGVRKRKPNNGILVVVEGVYGLDGDACDLTRMNHIVKKYDARFMVDDCQAVGVLGKNGRGSIEEYDCGVLPDVVMGSFSKALGSFGGYIATSHDVAQYLRWYAKGISFSIGLPPSCAASSLAAVRKIRDTPEIVADLRAKSSQLRDSLSGLGLPNVEKSNSAIMSIMVGTESAVRQATRDLFNSGIWVEGLPYPAVSKGQERLRFRARLSHTDQDIEEAVKAVSKVGQKYGFIKKQIHASGMNGTSIHDVMQLTYRSHDQKRLPITWATRQDKSDQLSRSGHWSETSQQHAWIRSGDPHLKAAVWTSHLEGQPEPTGVIGTPVWDAGCAMHATETIADAVNQLRDQGATRVLAPVQTPVQILGAGIPRCEGVPSSRPFLESVVDPELGPILKASGFNLAHSNHYFKATIPNAASPVDEQSLPGGIEIRDFDRKQFIEEIALIEPLLNQTISKLPLCQPLSANFLQRVANTLRDFILPGLWQIAMQGDQIVGFIASFPNVTEAIGQLAGEGDISDLVAVNEAIEKCNEGFIAWMAIDPAMKSSEQLACCLIENVMTKMNQRGIKTTWLSWELHTGKRVIGPSDIPTYIKDSDLLYDIYELTNSKSD